MVLLFFKKLGTHLEIRCNGAFLVNLTTDCINMGIQNETNGIDTCLKIMEVGVFFTFVPLEVGAILKPHLHIPVSLQFMYPPGS